MKKQKDAVMQFVQGLAEILKAKPEDIIQIAQQQPDALEVAVQKYQETQGDMTQAAQAFKDYLEKKTKVARHGAKLQYIKNLKNQCADDEEIYYYKVGGSLGCGCKKKENGVTKAEDGWKSKFKNRQQQKKGEVEQTYDEKTGKMRPATPAEIAQRRKNNQDAYKGKGEGNPPKINKGVGKNEKGGNLKKNCGGSTLKLKKKGGEVCPKCGKVHAAGMGCAVAKFKMHRQGGSLNGIPFIRQELPKTVQLKY